MLSCYNSVYVNKVRSLSTILFVSRTMFACALLSAGSVCEVTSQVLTGKVSEYT